MITLALRTDKPEAELYVYRDEQQMIKHSWMAHRELGMSIHTQIAQVLEGQNLNVHDIERILVYAGPGSFTGLRIGISVANALAYSLNMPVYASSGDSWLDSINQNNKTEPSYVTPIYGSDPHITAQKK